jgi:hypothetical protein
VHGAGREREKYTITEIKFYTRLQRYIHANGEREFEERN